MDAELNFGDFAVDQVQIDAADDEMLYEAVKLLEEKENVPFCRFPEMSEEEIDRLVQSRASAATTRVTNWSVQQFKSK